MICLFKGQRDRKGETERELFHLFGDSFAKGSQQVGLSQAKAKSQALHLSLPRGWQQPRDLGPHPLPPKHARKELDWKCSSWNRNQHCNMDCCHLKLVARSSVPQYNPVLPGWVPRGWSSPIRAGPLPCSLISLHNPPQAATSGRT